MKRELDLVRELADLTAAKIDSWGSLPDNEEKRFRELKACYEELLARREFQKIPASERYQVEELKQLLPKRGALRVPLGMNLFFCHGETYAPARARNLSRGGVFVGSPITVEPGSRLTLYLPNLGRGYEHLFEMAVDVIWAAAARDSDKPGMGVRFCELPELAENELDDFIVAYLRERLSKTNPLVLRPSSSFATV